MKETNQMDIVALIMVLSQMKAAQEISMPLMKMIMDIAENQVIDLLQALDTNIMDQSVNPHIGEI